MATLRLIPKDTSAQSALGGDCLAKEWLDTKSEDPAVVTGKGKDNSVGFKLATGGTLQNPQWSSAYTLSTTGTEINASDLSDAINAGLTHKGYNVVLVSCDHAGGTENFYAVVDGNNENTWPLIDV